jgi:hypothetical protein
VSRGQGMRAEARERSPKGQESATRVYPREVRIRLGRGAYRPERSSRSVNGNGSKQKSTQSTATPVEANA